MNRRDAIKGIIATTLATLAAPTLSTAPTPEKVAITVSMLLRAVFPSVAALKDRAYVLSEVEHLPTTHAYVAFLTDSLSGTRVPLAWSATDEASDEKNVINVTASLLENGFDVLDMLVSGEI